MDLDRELEYTMKMRPLLKKRALYSDETEMFRSPMEVMPEDEVVIRFRTAKNNVDAVYLHHGEQRMQLHFQYSSEGFDYYCIRIKVHKEHFEYYFEIRLGRTVCYYNRLGVVRNPSAENQFRILPGFSTPKWAKGAVMYQIFPDRFRNGDSSNDVKSDEYTYINGHVKKSENWYQDPEDMDVRNFYGGDLQGVIDKMDYLKKLGIEVIYLNPIFVSASNHKYDTQDYDYVDPHIGVIVTEEKGIIGKYGEENNFGLLADWDMDNTHATRYMERVTDKRNLDASNELFAHLVEEAHSRGMRVILDGVFNHCGSFNKWMDRERIYEGKEGYANGAYVSKDSPYHSYFQFLEGGNWPYNGRYDGWWGHDTLPKLNYEDSPILEADILRVAKKWVSPPYNCDGWRLDVAADLGHSPEYNHSFWKKFRKAVKEANPDAIVLAEHYGNPQSWLMGDEWDTVMNYDAFMEPVSWFLTGMEKHSDSYREDLLGNADSFHDAMRYNMAAYSMPSLLVSMNELDNHDHSRFLTRTNHKVGRVQNLGSDAASQDIDKAVMREAVVMQMTWPGAPTVYYGDEAGVCGFTDPDNRRTYPWGMEDRQMIDFYEKIIAVHKNHEALRTGSTLILHQDYNVLGYARFNEDEQVFVFVNNRMQDYELKAVVWPAGLNRVVTEQELDIIFTCDQEGFSCGNTTAKVVSGNLTMTLKPESAVVLVHHTKK